MEIIWIIVLVLFGALLGGGYFFWLKHNLGKSQETDKAFLMLQNQLSDLTRNFNEQMREQNKTMLDQLNRSQETLQKQFGANTKVIQDINLNSSKIVKEVTDRLSRLDETNRKVVSFAEQMKSLENILKNPKQRGILGEIFLENILSSVLPPQHYKMQYTFSTDRKIVDAVVFFGESIIPIDAKFSLELYNELIEEIDEKKREVLERDFKQSLKLRIDETSKYIRITERTTDFAMMFIPADGIFYNLLAHKVGTLSVNANNLIEYAFSKKVIIVSPMTFFAYLQTVMQSLHRLQVSRNVDDILKRIGQLGKHLNAYESYMQGLGKSLETSVRKYEDANSEFRKVNKDINLLSENKDKSQINLLPEEQIN